MTNKIQLKVYHGVEASVNAYVFYDDRSAIQVDCLRNSAEADLLAQKIKGIGKPLTHILITHGHPDHYLGLNVLTQAFPDAQVVVTRQEIKDDIIGFSGWMDTVGWLDSEPSMKVRTAENAEGFDYASVIGVLNSTELTLAGGAVLQLNSDYSSAECEHLTTIYSKDLNAFFPGDFVYHGVHAWLAVPEESRSYWKSQLERFRSKYADSSPAIYPGHGKPTDISVFDTERKYIQDFENSVNASQTRAEAMEKIMALYPEYQQAGFLLLNSINLTMAE
jgi:glyoxylase-like metal-dependent hydrolase (beta-lactamase superfamily II)